MSKTIIPAMPADLTWTSDQWKAIWASDQDILVAAAAGSGKTAVLVNRIIFKLLSEQVNVDELLVVTFTNASAAEMRHRIADALEGAINKNPESQHLRRQLSLINRASISTLHSFCLEVIRKYYYEIEIDPGFRIADTTEAEILKDEMLDELLEEQYGIENNESFFQLVDAFSSDRNDIELQNIVRTLHEFSSSHPYPEEWLDEMVKMYNINEDTSIDDLPFTAALKYHVQLQLSAARDSIEEALRITKMPGGPASRAETFDKDMQLLEKLEGASVHSWQDLFDAMSGLKFSTLKKATGDVDEELDKQCKKLRDQTKKIIQDLQKELFTRKPESYLNDMKGLKNHVAMLADLVKQFKKKYNQEKRDRGIVDFSDLEHYCLSIFAEKNKDGSVKPSRIALKYRQHFKEVLVDEYQDTNLVQETILKLVSKDSEYDGNMFMVGDVKQSIYRFRLAEPNLFLGKYNRYRHDGKDGGLRIDLNKNFRSRKEVLDGTNFLFKQLMGVTVGEIEYDDDAELKKGAAYPENEAFPIEVQFINQNNKDSDAEITDDLADFDTEELENVQLEARLLAKSIKEMINEKRQITDLKTGMKRAVTYRDIVILMRSMTWTPGIMEEFKKQGIPIYGNLSSGYFEATEVAIMMSLLKVIDNPLQDIPLASVLRSAIVGLNEEQLAQIKVTDTSGAFYDAVVRFSELGRNDENYDYYHKVERFVNQLAKWRDLARQQSLSDLIWQLYRDTKFYSYVGGMPGGKQRQANLRALFDRARQYEESSFRGLFRFLRFIERMQERGDDLGAARALSEQEDVVRIMTIHSSKGLEFPVVFVAGLTRQFNMMDLRKSYLLDKEFGFACSYTNPNLRITYPSLPQIAFKKKKQLEMIAEEMRVLYVALTRAKEKLILIGTLKDSVKSLEKWRKTASHNDWLLKDYVRATAKSYSDWIGAALARHKQTEELYEVTNSLNEIAQHPSNWRMEIIDAATLKVETDKTEKVDVNIWEAIKENRPVNITSPFEEKIKQQLNWQYENVAATSHLSKQTVTEIKRQFETNDRDGGGQLISPGKSLHDRPAFMQEKSLSSAEKGTIMHMVMQQINLREPVSEASLEALKLHLVQNEYLRDDQLLAVNNEEILNFFESDLAKRMQKAHTLYREVPFSMVIPAHEAYSDWQGKDEPVMLQGVIDCLFEDEQGLVLVDYKTDRITGRFPGGYSQAKSVLEKRYKVQIDLYSRAIEAIMKKELKEKYLYFFDDGGHLLEM